MLVKLNISHCRQLGLRIETESFAEISFIYVVFPEQSIEIVRFEKKNILVWQNALD